MLATWKMVIKYAATLFSGDNLVVVGGRADWCLYYNHDGVLTFARDPDFAKAAWQPERSTHPLIPVPDPR